MSAGPGNPDRADFCSAVSGNPCSFLPQGESASRHDRKLWLPYIQAESTHRPESRRAATAEAQPCLCSHLWPTRSRKLKGSTELQQLQRVHTNFKAMRIKCWSCRQDEVFSNVSEVKYKCWLLVTALLSSTLETRGALCCLLLMGSCHILVLQGAGINVCALL